MIKLEGLWLGAFLWIMLCCFLIQETLPSLHCVFNLSKIKFTKNLLAVLDNEDDYVDVSTLMLKITNYY